MMMMMRIVRSWLVGVGSNHTRRLLSRTPSFRFGRALTDAFDEPDDDSNDDGANVMTMDLDHHDNHDNSILVLMVKTNIEDGSGNYHCLHEAKQI